MFLRAFMALAVATLAAASAWGNYLHIQAMGAAVVLLVIAAEVMKPLLPLVAIHHMRNGALGSFIATAVVWCLIVAFSFVNTFGNALSTHATNQANLEWQKLNSVRTEHVILKEIGLLPVCGKKQPQCREKVTAQREALYAELKEARKKPENSKAHASPDAVRDGILALASWSGISIEPSRVFILITLIWTLLAEVGSAFGGLAIPRRDKDAPKTAKA